MGKGGKQFKSKRSLARLPKGLPVRAAASGTTSLGSSRSSAIITENPFDQNVQQRRRPKQFVHNRNSAGAPPPRSGSGSGSGSGLGTLPNSSSLASWALQQRQEMIREDRRAAQQHASNRFLDRRLTAATPQEQALQRLIKERHARVSSKRAQKFNLMDDDDDDIDHTNDHPSKNKDEVGFLLTHQGKKITELTARDHVILSDDEEEYGTLDQLDTDLHFGGGTAGARLNPISPYGPSGGSGRRGGAGGDPTSLSLSAVYSSRKTELDELIQRRKLAKLERLQRKEEQEDTFEKFDHLYRQELAPLLQFRNHARNIDVDNDPSSHNNQFSNDKDRLFRTNNSSNKEDNDDDDNDDMDNWNREMKALQLIGRKAVATDRTLTKEEIATKEAERLHQLETKRLARMNGDFEDDDLSDILDATTTMQSTRQVANRSCRNPELLDDEIAAPSANDEYRIKFTADGLVKLDKDGNVIKEEEVEADTNAPPDIIHAVGTRIQALFRVNEQIDEYAAWHDGVIRRVNQDDTTGIVTYDIDYDDGDFEDNVLPSNIRLLEEASTKGNGKAHSLINNEQLLKFKRQAAKDNARSTLPFVFEVPTTLDALHEMISTHAKTGKDASTIIQRIHAVNSVKLDHRNTEKMQNFYDVLLRRMIAVGDAISQSGDGGPELGRYQQLDVLTVVLFKMAQDNGESAGAVWSRRLGFFQKAHAKRLRDANFAVDEAEDESIKSAWPSSGVFVTLRALGHIFPVTDLRHPVVTPALLLLGQMVSHTPVRSLHDLVMGTLCTGLLIEYAKEAKRVVPEVLAFLGGLIRLFAPNEANKHADLFTHPALGEAASQEPFLSLRTHVSSTSGILTLPKLSLQKALIEPPGICSMAVLAAALDLITVYAHALPMSSKECFVEISKALCVLEPRNSPYPLPKVLWCKITPAIEAIERHELMARDRAPLQRRRVQSLVSTIKSLAPRLESSVSSRKRMRNASGNTETAALRHELTRENKAIKRELQWDAALVEQARRSDQAKHDKVTSDKRHRAFAWLEQQQGELNQQVRQGGGLLKGGGIGAARSKARTGKLGMKKGSKLK